MALEEGPQVVTYSDKHSREGTNIYIFGLCKIRRPKIRGQLIYHQKITLIEPESQGKIKLETSKIRSETICIPISANLQSN
ncbi:hypothetical protein KFK09_003261 [Dendrobium nobile]|uniref:Uncharacterized protein n=1 Tax=Dendrobium nobile TaxID=94219 RepID=A0A8T3C9M7_DENNO|nr:hypothetical protein KFK09_003261 [Dendrobium nobile]